MVNHFYQIYLDFMRRVNEKLKENKSLLFSSQSSLATKKSNVQESYKNEQKTVKAKSK